MAHHAACLDLLAEHDGPLLVPALCVAEVSHLLGRAGGQETEEPVEPADLLRTAELVSVYRDLPFRTVDASVVAAAERLEITTIATLDRHHFGVLRPANVDSFELLP